MAGVKVKICNIKVITNEECTQPFYSSLDFVRDNPVSRYQKKHSLTHTYCGHQLYLICFTIYCDPWHPPCSLTVFFHKLCPSLAWHPPLHSPYISSHNHCLLFAAHAHTIATCFAVVPRLCHLILVSLNPLLGTLSCSFMPHIHLTILISAG